MFVRRPLPQSVFDVPYVAPVPPWCGLQYEQIISLVRRVFYQSVFSVPVPVGGTVTPPAPSLAREAYDTFLDRIRCVAIDHQFSAWHSCPSQPVIMSFAPVFTQF